eukprot:CAMPEP_0185031110 /NCGR_PEP_ID=MMETSP1103-20130426/18398_1 /TAXON_ID=36769 /ORGANISM="Paraphysomonas bandaiensis, Strain Caron Lab Isolate" /LENGTH=709 /DNA_ID=CAMNT_0027566511 /DNA_START=107 /DNA_END=2236 /DNA_ORIENTATION=-
MSSGMKSYTSHGITYTSHDFTRLMMQSLHNLGYSETAKKLEEESGVQIQSRATEQLFSAISIGDWELCCDLLKHIEFFGKSRDDIVGMIFEVKYMELIQRGDVEAALKCLRTEIRENVLDIARMKSLAACVLCRYGHAAPLIDIDLSPPLLCSRASLSTEVRRWISPQQMVSEFRLEELVTQALRWQMQPDKESTTHYGTPRPCSLLTDVTSVDKQQVDARRLYPHGELAILRAHTDEVWCVQFSRCGHFIASASVDGTVRVWAARIPPENPATHPLTIIQCPGQSPGAGKAVHISWNQSSTYLLFCCENDAGVYRWSLGDVLAPDGISSAQDGDGEISSSVIRRYSHHEFRADESSSSAVEVVAVEWLPGPASGEREYFVSLSANFLLFLCDLEGDVFAVFGGLGHASAMAVLPQALSSGPSPSHSRDNRNIDGKDGVLRGWKPHSSIDESGTVYWSSATCGHETTVSSIEGDGSFPCGCRALVAKSEVVIQLFVVTKRLSSENSESTAPGVGRGYSPPYQFTHVAELVLSTPVVSLGSVSGFHLAQGDNVVVASLFGGEIVTVIAKNDRTLEEGSSYYGLKQHRFVVSPCIGGVGNGADRGTALIASGGEDASILLWAVDDGTKPTRSLEGHAGPVNAVSWSPIHPGLLASASDDHTVRLWAPEEICAQLSSTVAEIQESNAQSTHMNMYHRLFFGLCNDVSEETKV